MKNWFNLLEDAFKVKKSFVNQPWTEMCNNLSLSFNYMSKKFKYQKIFWHPHLEGPM